MMFKVAVRVRRTLQLPCDFARHERLTIPVHADVRLYIWCLKSLQPVPTLGPVGCLGLDKHHIPDKTGLCLLHLLQCRERRIGRFLRLRDCGSRVVLISLLMPLSGF